MAEAERAQPSQNILAPMNEEEYFSLKSAMGVMLIISIVVLVTYAIGIRLFSDELYLGVVFTPAIILILGWLVTSRKRSGK